MKEDKRQLLLKVFSNQKTDRVPVGFWHHFVTGKDQFRGLEDESILEKAYKDHLAYYHFVKPDMMKIMSEGFFGYPPVMDKAFDSEKDLLDIKAIGKNHPWIKRQVEHVGKIVDAFSDEVMTFYNIFAPLQVMRIKFDFHDYDYGRFVWLAESFPEAFKQAGLEIQKDITVLIEELFKKTKLDGIYYCVQNIQSPQFGKERYQEMITPTELPALLRANELRENNILHICGYANYKNDLSFYKDYPSKVYNWAIHTEGVSLKEGKELFDNHCVLGGFDNNINTIIHKGSNELLEKEVKKLIKENDYNGFVIGADCSLPDDILDENLRFIRETTEEIIEEKEHD